MFFSLSLSLFQMFLPSSDVYFNCHFGLFVRRLWLTILNSFTCSHQAASLELYSSFSAHCCTKLLLLLILITLTQVRDATETNYHCYICQNWTPIKSGEFVSDLKIGPRRGLNSDACKKNHRLCPACKQSHCRVRCKYTGRYALLIDYNMLSLTALFSVIKKYNSPS